VDARARLEAFYREAPFVRPLDESPRVAVLAAMHNLGKGMAGEAIQNLNLALGLDERTGLWRAGRWPN
jgi:N-acetyl-gamma-glutamyl-phosphate reductase